MKDIVTELLYNASVVKDGSYRGILTRAAEEIEWLRKEAKMWRLRATQAALRGTGVASQVDGDATPETQP